jgi:hypothetical protein
MVMLDGGSALSLLCVFFFLCFFSFPFLSPVPLSLLPLSFSLKMAQGGAAAGAMERNRNGGFAAWWLCQPVLLFSFFFTVLQQGRKMVIG